MHEIIFLSSSKFSLCVCRFYPLLYFSSNVFLPFCVSLVFTAQVLTPQKLYSCWDRNCNNPFENTLTPKGITIPWWEHRHDDLFVPGPRQSCFSFSLPAGASTFLETLNDTTGKKKMNGTSEPVSDLINCAGILVLFGLLGKQTMSWSFDPWELHPFRCLGCMKFNVSKHSLLAHLIAGYSKYKLCSWICLL